MQRSRSLQMTRMTRAHNELKIVWKLKSQYALVAAPCAVIPQSASLLTFTSHNLDSTYGMSKHTYGMSQS